MPMFVLSISHMFPNRIQPNNGIFVKERLKYMAKKIQLEVVSPIPYFPLTYMIPKYRGLNNVPKQDEIDGLHTYHPRYWNIPKYFKICDGYFYYYSIHKYIEHIINQKKINILDFHWVYPDAYAGMILAKKLKIKFVVTLRGNESICYYEKSLRKNKVIETLKAAAHIISVSQDLKNKIVTEYGINDNKVTVIPNGIDTIKFGLLEKNHARKLCNLDHDKKYILTVCRLSPEKGLEHLIKAFSNFKEDNIHLLIAGGGPLKELLLNMVSSLGIIDKVHFLGTISHQDINKWYNVADVFCLPSLWEGCPNVIIESLCCGTPVVSTCVGGIPDLVPSDNYGLLVPPGDSNLLFEALNNALRNNWDKMDIAQFGSQNTWEHVADKVINVFEGIA